ncbi:VOC family protein [Pontibacter sp. JH31]|uniref:VOC family protein n=1 Tax=Pontibacter aquaedesilientis TaxID=2766980 RepID=A0ABR7XFQ0_9BACT|nr:VOC family protein [Pontibacter aquaedesilientis]MBD1397125.1 VOC family protein [Pontibacter aquaedesilientis]
MKITSIELQTSQPGKLKDFYTQTLGLSLVAEDTKQFSIQAGSSTITFRTVPERANEPYHFAFNIPSNQITAASQWLQEKVAFLYAPGATSPVVEHESWEAQALYFYDPDFNIVELIAHKRSPESLAAFGPQQLMGLADIGIAVTDVTGFCEEVREKLQLPRWKSATALFEAVGDEKGMFIVVQEKRPWFPTQNPALTLPTRVEVLTAGIATIRRGPIRIDSTTGNGQV